MFDIVCFIATVLFFFFSFQTMAFSSENGTLTEEMMDNVVKNAVEANKKKQEWRQHRLPDAHVDLPQLPSNSSSEK